MEVLNIMWAVLLGSILYTLQEAIKYFIDDDRTFSFKVWVKTNYKTWLYSLGGSLLAVIIYVFIPQLSDTIGGAFGVTLDGSTASFILVGGALGSVIKTKIEANARKREQKILASIELLKEIK